MKALALLLALTAIARADAPTWDDAGVSKETETAVNARLQEANDLFALQAYVDALAKYREALALWDHPRIHANIAVVLIRLERFLEAADELERALAYGDRPFSKPEHYSEALGYRALVNRLIAELDASCDKPGPQILLDGKQWFACPGAAHARLLAGPHVLVGERAGSLTVTRHLALVGGTHTRETIELISLEDATTFVYPYPRWIPYTIAGGGAALAIAGLAVFLAARTDSAQADNQWNVDCPQGCLASDPHRAFVLDQRASALRNGKIGAALLVTGSAITVGGAVFAILNRPTRLVPDLELARGSATARISWRF